MTMVDDPRITPAALLRKQAEIWLDRADRYAESAAEDEHNAREKRADEAANREAAARLLMAAKVLESK